jgi:putative transposase
MDIVGFVEDPLAKPLGTPQFLEHGSRRTGARRCADRLGRWEKRRPKPTEWARENIRQTLAFHHLPHQHHTDRNSTNLLKRLDAEIKRHPWVARIFPNAESRLRLIRALCAETHEAWLEDNRDINMDPLKEHRKVAMKLAA